MKQTYTNEQVCQCCTAYASGQSVSELAKKLELHIPDEKSRRVGQSVAAASLPKVK